MIRGKLKLFLNSPRKARGLRVRLVEESTSFSGGKRSVTYIVLNEVVLGGEGSYETREYDFEIPAPRIASPPSDIGGIAGAVVGVAQALGVSGARSRYLLDASLELPMAFDINRKLYLNIA